MRNDTERQLFLAMYDEFKSHGYENENGFRWHPPVNYQAVTTKLDISDTKANKAIFFWIKMGWMTDQPPRCAISGGISITIGGGNFYFTKDGEAKARELLKSANEPRNRWKTFTHWWQHNLIATIIVIAFIFITAIRGLIAFYNDILNLIPNK